MARLMRTSETDPSVAKPAKSDQIEKVHHSQHQNRPTELAAERFETLLHSLCIASELWRETHDPQSDQSKTNNQQMRHRRTGFRVISVTGPGKRHAVNIQFASHPQRDSHASRHKNGIRQNDHRGQLTQDIRFHLNTRGLDDRDSLLTAAQREAVRQFLVLQRDLLPEPNLQFEGKTIRASVEGCQGTSNYGSHWRLER